MVIIHFKAASLSFIEETFRNNDLLRFWDFEDDVDLIDALIKCNIVEVFILLLNRDEKMNEDFRTSSVKFFVLSIFGYMTGKIRCTLRTLIEAIITIRLFLSFIDLFCSLFYSPLPMADMQDGIILNLVTKENSSCKKQAASQKYSLPCAAEMCWLQLLLF